MRKYLEIKTTYEKHLAVALYLVSFLLILANGYFSASGYLSRDGTSYLRLAENILMGNGLQVPNAGRYSAHLVHFAVWPVGYPVMIAAAASILHVSAFLASKLLNGLLLLASMAVTAKSFGKNGPALCSILVFGGTADLFSNTWSEAPFVFFLICFSAVLGGVVASQKTSGVAGALLLLILGLLLFLSRYIGAFSVGVIFLASAYKYYCNARRQSAWLAASATVLFVLIVAYLGYNKIQTGYSTGMERTPAPEASLELAEQWLASFVSELVLPLQGWDPAKWKLDCIVAVQILAMAIVFAPLPKLFEFSWFKTSDRMSETFIAVGVIYLVAITVLRWRSYFDPFDNRMLDPGVVLLLMGIFNALLAAAPELRKRVVVFLFGMAALSIGFQLYELVAEMRGTSYAQATTERMAKYKDIPEGSIVVFADMHLNYLRPDLYVAFPTYTPSYPDAEPWDEFINSLDGSRRIFVEISEEARIPDGYHESVKAFYAEHKNEALFELKKPEKAQPILSTAKGTAY